MLRIVFLLFLVFGSYKTEDVDVKEEPSEPHMLFVTVYYESKCPDSRAFILKQVVPAMEHLQGYLMFKFIPFGKSKSINNGNDGFHCPHGQASCYGDIVHDCTLHLMQDYSEYEKVQYIACEMKTRAATRDDFQCVEKANVPVEDVRECIASGKGLELQLDSEYYTKLLKPKWVPTVTVDGVFDQEVQNEGLKDLTTTLCSFLKETPHCMHYYNKLALKHIFTNPTTTREAIL